MELELKPRIYRAAALERWVMPMLTKASQKRDTAGKRNVRLVCSVTLYALSFLVPSTTFGASIPIAVTSWDVTIPGSTGQFDIANETGPNSSGDPTFPVTTPVNLGSLLLNVKFSDGSSRQFDSNAFALNPFDGLSFEGPAIAIGGQSPKPLEATLTGKFLTASVTEFDRSQFTVIFRFFSTHFKRWASPS